MARIGCVIALAVAMSGGYIAISQASPIAPLPAGVVSDVSSGNFTRVRWWRPGWHWRGPRRVYNGRDLGGVGAGDDESSL
jgi:hypothetical protein